MSEKKASERSERIQKLEKLKKLAINPFPSKSNRDHMISDIFLNFDDLQKKGKAVSIAGRLCSIRIHGNLTFCNIKDASGNIQLAFSKKELINDEYKNFVNLIDEGDFIEVFGCCFFTHRQEKSIMVQKWKLLTKAVRPLPSSWFGFKDEEKRLRKRYLDILLNPEIKELIIKKERFWQTIRSFLKEKGFLEVETPTLEATASGADAKPFKTHHNDFDMDVYLRICVGELWQKRLMAAGFEKTFEIGRAYRNEGSSSEHLQEFTNVEFYWAYADYQMGMKLVKRMYKKIAKDVFQTTKFKIKNFDVDLNAEWIKIDYRQEVLKQTGIDVLAATENEMKNKLDDLKVKFDGKTKERLIDSLWKYCRKNIAGPAFLINEPKIISPLAKSREDNPALTERFHVIIAGSEIGQGFSELNDPIDQRQRFDSQQKLLKAGDEEAMAADYDFVEMLEYGMPPVCGFGFGERLFSFFENKPLRETQIFPLMKPKI